MKPDETKPITPEEDTTLKQSMALNKIVMSMLEANRKSDLWLKIILIVSILTNVLIAGMFLHYESQFTTTKEITTTTVEQDTGEGSGNNVYQSGSYADYVQGNLEEGMTDGEADSDYDYRESDQIPE